MAPSFWLFLSIFGTVLADYPFYAVPYRNNPPAPLHEPPTYLIYPHGVYQLTNASLKEHDFVFGARSPQDKLLLHSTVFKKPGFWSNYATKEITFPPAESYIKVNITQVVAHDRAANATGGFVKITKGGIGRENVTLFFRSLKSKPINFELDIYGTLRR